jgi:SAM-dependent methyltransferase
LCDGCQLLVSDLDFEKILGARASSGYYESLDTENIKSKFQRVMSMGPKESDNWTRVRRILKNISEFQSSFGLVQGRRALDIGSGTGVFAARLLMEDSSWSVDCVEPDPRACLHIQEVVSNASVFCGTLGQCENLQTYDLITLNRVLEHLPDPLIIVRQIKTLLNPGGVVYIEVPDLVCYSLFGADAPEFGVEHLSIWSPQALICLIHQSGLIDLQTARYHEPSGKISSVIYATNLADLKVKRACG